MAPFVHRGGRHRTASGAVGWLTLLLLQSLRPSMGQRDFGPTTLDDPLALLLIEVGLAPGAKITLNVTNELPGGNVTLAVLSYGQVHVFKDDSKNNGYTASTWRAPLLDNIATTLSVRAARNDRYWLLVLNPHQNELRLVGSVGYRNPGGSGLKLQSAHYPTVLSWAAALFGTSTAALIASLLTVWRQRCTALHAVMAVTWALKALLLLLQYVDFEHQHRTGGVVTLQQTAWQFVEVLQTVAELLMFLLVAFGWRIVMPTLTSMERRFAMGVAFLSIMLGVFGLGEEPDDASVAAQEGHGFGLARYIVHSLCDLVIIVTLNYNLQVAYAQILNAPASPEVAPIYTKHRAYCSFRWIFLAAIVAPTFELFVRVSVMPWDGVWACVLVENLRVWLLYAWLFSVFRPHPKAFRVFELAVRGNDEWDRGRLE